MTPLTSVDGAAVTASSDRLASMIGPQSAFDALRDPVPDLGALPEAQWLRDVIDQRSHAVAERIDAWRRDFAETTARLRRSAEGMVDADQDAARTVSGGGPVGGSGSPADVTTVSRRGTNDG